MSVALHRNEHFIATTLTVVFHLFIVICIMITGSRYILLPQQSIQMNLVAPSQNLKIKLNNQSKIRTNSNSLDKIGIKASEQSKSNDNTMSIERKTSGIESADSKILNSAITEPIFNATYLKNPVPIYPAMAKRDGIQGTVLLLVDVSEDGTAKSVKISRSSNYSLLDNEAMNTVSSWKFIPAKRNGMAIHAFVLVPIEFKLS